MSDAVAGVVVLAGPSGSGKSHLTDRLGWPVLRLDDFYRDHDAPAMPMSDLGIIDWDDPATWDADAAVAAIEQLCATGEADVPVYDIAQSRAVGHRTVRTDGRPFIAEGLFADEIVDRCRDAGILAHAICLQRPRAVTFGLRLARDLREGRKSPGVLLRRGWRLMRDEPRVVAHAVANGCTPMSPRRAHAVLSGSAAPTPRR